MFNALYPAFLVKDSSTITFSCNFFVKCENVNNLGLYRLKGFNTEKSVNSWSFTELGWVITHGSHGSCVTAFDLFAALGYLIWIRISGEWNKHVGVVTFSKINNRGVAYSVSNSNRMKISFSIVRYKCG